MSTIGYSRQNNIVPIKMVGLYQEEALAGNNNWVHATPAKYFFC